MNDSSIRIPLLLIGIFFLGFFMVVYLFISNNKDEPAPDQSATTTPVVPQLPLATKNGLLTKEGTIIVGRDFLADDTVKIWDVGAKTYLLNEEVGVDGTLYQIFYFNGGGITVSLLDQNLQFARSRAETFLQNSLGLSSIQMCSLVIRVTTPRFVNEDLSGTELGLSFCPGSLAL